MIKAQTFFAALASLLLAAVAHAGEAESQPPQQPAASEPQGKPITMAELPKMKAEGERIAALMEKLQKEGDPAERRKIMSELMCPQ